MNKAIALTDFFDSIKMMGVKCAVISDSTMLPSHNANQQVIIIFDLADLGKIASIPNLFKGSVPGGKAGGDYAWRYVTSHGGDIPIMFVPKGSGILPDRFCSEVLAQSGWEKGVPVPQQRHRAAINLHFANRNGLLKLIFCGNQLSDIVEMIESIVGSGVNVSEVEPCPTVPPQYSQVIASAGLPKRPQ